MCDGGGEKAAAVQFQLRAVAAAAVVVTMMGKRARQAAVPAVAVVAGRLARWRMMRVRAHPIKSAVVPRARVATVNPVGGGQF